MYLTDNNCHDDLVKVLSHMKHGIQSFQMEKKCSGLTNTTKAKPTNQRQMSMGTIKFRQNHKAHTIELDENADLNIDDFDPVFRKREFQNVKKYALDVLDLRRNYTSGQFNEMRAEVH
jgi:hypothetical protein